MHSHHQPGLEHDLRRGLPRLCVSRPPPVGRGRRRHLRDQQRRLAGRRLPRRLLARTFGLGMTLGLSILLGGLVTLATPLALIGVPAVILGVLGFLNNLMVPVYNINQVSLRQSITPDRVQGRMNATMRTIVWGTIPVGAFAGGILGTTIGVVPTIILGSVVSALAALWIFLGPVARLKEQPVPAPA